MSKTKQKRMAAYLLLLSLCGGSVGAATQPDSPHTPNNVGAYIYVDGSSTNTTFNVGTVSGWQGTNQGAVVNYYSGKNVTLNSLPNSIQSYISNAAGIDAAGAIYNSSKDQSVSVTINGEVEFIDNSANRGGDIYNDGTMIFNNGNVTFKNNKGTDFSLKNWSGGGAIVNIDGKLEFNSGKVVFNGNTANGNGGAILAGDTGLHKYSPASVDFNTETEFNDNSSTNVGGAIANFDSTLNVDQTNGKVSFDGNKSDSHGGAIYNEGTANLGEKASFTNNVAQGNGGAIFNNVDAVINAGNNIVFKGNTSNAQYYGGGAISNQGSVEIGNNALFEENYLGGVSDPNNGTAGGAIASWNGGSIELGNNASFINNGYTDSTHSSIASAAGGAVYVSGGGNNDPLNQGSFVAGDNLQFIGNATNGSGGGLYVEGSNVQIGNNAVFKDNFSTSGGAIYNYEYNDVASDVKIGENALFKNNNVKDNSGGAIFNYGGDLNVDKNATFSGNTAGYAGGAIKNYGTATVGEASTFVNNSASAIDNGGGAISNSGEMTVSKGALFDGNSSAFAGGAVYNDGTSLVIQGGVADKTLADGSVIQQATEFVNNSSASKGGALYNSGSVDLVTSGGDIAFSGNTAADIANDIYAAASSHTNISGTGGNVSIGSGLFSETGSFITVNNTSNLVIEENVTAQIGGDITTSTTANVVNNGEINISGTGSGNLVNNGTLTVDNGGKYVGNVIQTNDDSTISVLAGGTFGSTSVLDGGILSIATGGKVDSTVNVTVTENVLLKVADSVVFDTTGLRVGGDPSNGHIKGTFNFGDTEVSFASGTQFTQDMTLSGDSKITTSDSIVNIGSGTSSNTLTLSNGSHKAAGGKGFNVTAPATIKLSPDAGKSMILDENVKGNGEVLVDEKITMVDNPEYDPDKAAINPSYSVPEKIPHKWGVGTVNITSDNHEFSGNFLQKMGTVIAQAGSKFFGRTNKVQGGTLVLQDGADLTSEVNVIADGSNGYGTVNIYNDIKGTVGADGVNRIDADSIANGNNAVIGYINSDDSVVNVNVKSAGLGLFNGTRVTGDLTLKQNSGVRDLTFGNGSGAESDNIILNEATKLTYADNAYIKDNSTVSVGENASLNFANNSTNIVYNPVISSTADTAAINQTGAGKTTIASSLENFNGEVNVNNGILELASSEDKYLSAVNVNNGALDVKGNLAVENAAGDDGKLTVNNGSLAVEKAIETNSDLTLTDANLSVGDYLAVGENANMTDSFVNIANEFVAVGDLSVDNTQLNVGGESAFKSLSVTGDNSVVNLNKSAAIGNLTTADKSVVNLLGNSTILNMSLNNDSVVNLRGNSQMTTLSVYNNAVLNTAGNIKVNDKLTIGDVESDNPTINMVSGSINTINADSVVVNSNANISFDVDPRTQTTDQIVSSNIINNTGTSGDPFQLLVGGINFTTSPIDRNVQFDISNLLTDPNGGHADMVKLPDGGFLTNTAMGQYLVTSSGAGSPILTASLMNFNPQQYRGQVATIASWQNQLVVNNLLFDHVNLITSKLIEEERTANKYASAIPFIDKYQYSVKDGGLWYKAYGVFETLSMTKGLNVGNNAYGSLIGADFPLIKLGNGWKIVPTAYIAYNGGHQHFSGVSMYQNGAQLGFMGTAYKGNFMTSLLAYGGGYANDMSVRGQYGSGSDTTGNWFAGVASKSAYNIHLPHDFVIQPAFMAAYNAFGQQNWSSNFGAMSMSSGMLNGINLAPGLNFIWQKKTFSIYATTQLVYNIMGSVDGKAGNIDTDHIRMRHCYFEYGLGVMKKFKDTFSGYLQFSIRNGGRTGIGFSGGLQWKIGK